MKENDKHWYPIRVTYSQEMKVKSYFDACQIASFIPMRYSEIQRNGQSKIKLVPVIHNLVFVYCTKNEIEQIKREQYLLQDKIHNRQGNQANHYYSRQANAGLYIGCWEY